MNKTLVIFSFILAIAGFLPLAAEADGGSLYLSPSTGTFFVGSTFDVSIFVNTGENDVNAVKIDLKFDPKVLQIASPTAGKSFISVWIAQPTYSNIKGTASFQGGVPSPGINTSSGLVSTITFRAITPGRTIVSFLDSSQILLDDGMGTNVLGFTSRGMYEIVIPPPEGPKVFSATHPDQNKWYRNNNLSFGWEKEEGITGFSYSIDYNSYGVPDNTTEGDLTSVSYTDLEDGIWYFHVKAKKAEVWGGVSHYLVRIDATPPASFTLAVEPVLGPEASPIPVPKKPIVTFFTTDALSGIGHYEIKTVNLMEAGEKAEVSFFVEADSPYRLPISEPGEHEVVVRAFDLAGNWRDASKKIEIVSSESPVFATKKGVSIFGFFLSWKWIILVVLALVVLSLVLIFRFERKKTPLFKMRKKLKDLKENGQKSGREIEKKLEEISSNQKENHSKKSKN